MALFFLRFKEILLPMVLLAAACVSSERRNGGSASNDEPSAGSSDDIGGGATPASNAAGTTTSPAEQSMTGIDPSTTASEVLNPGQPNSKVKDAVWITEPGFKTELFSSFGPLQEDVLQGQNNDCVVFALIGSLLLSSREKIEDMFRLVGKTTDGVEVYAVSLYDLSGKRFEILVDTKTLVKVTYGEEQTRYEFVYDNARVDEASGAVIVWPSLVQKALAVYFGGYESFPGFVSAVVPVLTGKYASAIMNQRGSLEDFGSPAELLKKYVDMRSPMTVDSALARPNQANDGSGLEVHQAGAYNCIVKEGFNYCLVGEHEYEIVGFDGSRVTLRNPWGSNVGDFVRPNGIVSVPLSVYTALVTTTWVIGRAVTTDSAAAN